MAKAADRPFGKTVQISSISTTIRSKQKLKDLSVKVESGGVRIEKQKFKEKLVSKIEFKPPRSIGNESTLRVKLCQSQLFREVVLSEMEFTVQSAQAILGHQIEVIDHLVFSDGVADFHFTFSMKLHASEDLVRVGVEVAQNLKSVLDYFGESYKFIDTLLGFAEAASEVNPIAKAVLASVNKINKLLHEQDDCDKAIRDLILEMADCLHCIADVRQFAKSAELLNALEQVDPLVSDTANFISEYSVVSPAAAVFSLNFSDKTKDELSALNRRFSSFKRRFDRGVAAQAGLSIEEIKKQLNVILDDSTFQAETIFLRALKPGASDIRQGPEGCMEGTRVDILGAIDEWINDSDGPTIFWLRGHPGTGKSAIAASVRARLLETRRLGSSFFFQREDFATQTPEALWCSIAYDLAHMSTAVRLAVVEKLKSQEIVPSISTHTDIFDKIIAGPLALPPGEDRGRPLVIVIDALDECGGLQQSQSYQKKVLWALDRCKSLPLKIKIFVTSRNEGNIESVLGTGTLRCRILEVGESATPDSSLDIKRYLVRGFEEIRNEYTTIQLPWPTEPDLQLLADTAAGLFIWASTILNLVRDGNPRRELGAILAMIQSQGVHMSPNMDLLGELYGTLLASKFQTKDQASHFMMVAGAVIAARTPLSPQDLVALLSAYNSNDTESLDLTDIETICKKLKSVLATESGLRFLHQSFADFLLKLPPDSQFHCNKAAHEKRLAVACLTTMEQKLHFNMGNIKSSYFGNKHIPGLINRISSEVYYSCRFWAPHLWSLESDDFALLRQVEKVIHHQFFFWLEVLSIREEASIAPASLELLLAWKPLNNNPKLRELVKDALVFVHSYATPIAMAVPHIYLSAFAFAPRNSLIKELYSRQISGIMKIEAGDDLAWHPLQAVVHGHTECVTSVAFSHDSRWVVSGADDHTLRIWDVEANRHVGTLAGHTNSVTSVSFSRDDKRIVSGSSDSTIRIWDSKTFEQVGRTLSGHTHSVYSVAFSPDGKRIMSGSGDLTVRIWDVELQEQVGKPLTGHTDQIRSVAYFPDGKSVISGSQDCSIRIWDAQTQVQVGKALNGHTDQIRSVAVSPTGTRIASGSHDGTVRIWDAQTHQAVGLPIGGHIASVTSVAFSHDGNLIVSGSNDRTIRIWNVESREQIGKPLDGHEYYVRSVAFSPNGKYITSGANDCTVRIWNVEMQQQVVDLRPGHTERVNCVDFSPDGQYIASASDDGTIRVWGAETYKQVGEPLTGHAHSVHLVAFSHDGKHLASASADCTVRLWDAETFQHVGTIAGHASFITSIAFSPDDNQIISAFGDRAVRIWNVDTQNEVGEFLTGHTWRPRPVIQVYGVNTICVEFSRDGNWLLSGGDDHMVRIWEVETYQQLRTLKGHTDIVMSVTFSRDDKYIASVSGDCTIRIWDSQTFELIGEPLTGHTAGVLSAVFSPDDMHIASGSGDHTVRIWDSATHLQLGDSLVGHTDYVRSVAYSPDGKYLVSGSDDRSVRLWNAETRVQLGEPLLGHTHSVRSVTFFPSGLSIVSGSYDGTVRIWDAESMQQVGTITGHTGAVVSVALSSDGRHIASGSYDTTIMVWDAETHVQVGETFRGHVGRVRGVAFSPDGRRIASGSNDRTIHMWNTEPQKPVEDSPDAGHTDWLRAIAYSPDGKYIITASEDQSIRFWDVNTYVQIGKPLVGHTGGVMCVSFSPDGRRVVSGSSDFTIRIWDVETHEQIGETLAGHSGFVSSVAFSPNDRYIVSGSGDRTVRLWDLESHVQLGRNFTGHTANITWVVFSPNGKCVVSASWDHSVRIWDADIRLDGASTDQDNGPPNILHPGRNYLSPAVSMRSSWLVNLNHNTLLWIPDHLKPRLPLYPLIAICGGETMIHFDTSNFPHGDHWTRCWTDLPTSV